IRGCHALILFCPRLTNGSHLRQAADKGVGVFEKTSREGLFVAGRHLNQRRNDGADRIQTTPFENAELWRVERLPEIVQKRIYEYVGVVTALKDFRLEIDCGLPLLRSRKSAEQWGYVARIKVSDQSPEAF